MSDYDTWLDQQTEIRLFGIEDEPEQDEPTEDRYQDGDR